MVGARTFGRTLAARRWGYRRGQSFVLTGLAALVVAACAAGPLYERAVEQATVRSTLSSAARTDRGVQLDVASTSRPARSRPPVRRDTCSRPRWRARTSRSPCPCAARRPIGDLAYRDDVCRHVTLASGRCPSAANEVLASSTSAAATGMQLGQHITLFYAKNKLHVVISVVGLYRPFRGGGDYWYSSDYTSTAGLADIREATATPPAPG